MPWGKLPHTQQGGGSVGEIQRTISCKDLVNLWKAGIGCSDWHLATNGLWRQRSVDHLFYPCRSQRDSTGSYNGSQGRHHSSFSAWQPIQSHLKVLFVSLQVHGSGVSRCHAECCIVYRCVDNVPHPIKTVHLALLVCVSCHVFHCQVMVITIIRRKG